MEDFYYFPAADVLIKIVYITEPNSLRYATHRPISLDERQLVEQYILTEVGPKTDYYKKTPSLLLYMGVDISLEKELRYFRLKGTLKDVLTQKANVERQVKDLINTSLSTYYFERVGDELVRLKKLLAEDRNSKSIEEIVYKICTFLDAYNQYSGQNISIESLLPKKVLIDLHYSSNGDYDLSKV